MLAFVCGFFLLRWLAKNGYCALPADKVSDFIMWAALFGVVVGGRLGYVLFYRFQETIDDPLSLLRVWQGGMSSHGGIIGLVLFTLYYAWRHRLSWFSLADNLGVVAPIGLFLGRCANFINGELYGRPSTVPWAVQFPSEMVNEPDIGSQALAVTQGIDPSIASVEQLIEQARDNQALQDVLAATLTPRHPSQLYEALLEGVFLFACLWFLRVKTRLPRGVLAGAFFLLYAIVRIAVENFREPDAPLTGPLTRGQALSIFLIGFGVFFVVRGLRRKEFEAAQR